MACEVTLINQVLEVSELWCPPGPSRSLGCLWMECAGLETVSNTFQLSIKCWQPARFLLWRETPQPILCLNTWKWDIIPGWCLFPHHRNVDISQCCHLLCEYLIACLKPSLLIVTSPVSPAYLLHTTSFLSMTCFMGDEPKLRSRQRKAADAAVLDLWMVCFRSWGSSTPCCRQNNPGLTGSVGG